MKEKLFIFKEFIVEEKLMIKDEFVLPFIKLWTMILDIKQHRRGLNMLTQYDVEIDNNIIMSNLNRIQSQIFALLPMREEEKD